jgi:hypothetical protein
MGQPVPCFGGVSVIKVSDRRLRERLEKRRHRFLPFMPTQNGEALNIGKMFEIEYNVIAKSHCVPVAETSHIEYHVQFPLFV